MDSIIDLNTLKDFVNADENNKNFKLKGVYLIEKVIYLQDEKALTFLLEQNANILIPKLLEQPIKFNNKNIIDILFNFSSQTYEIVDSKKHNAFHYAIKYFNNYVIDFLIDNINLFDVDYKNNNYIHYAIKQKNNYVIEKLIDKIFNERNVDKMENSLINLFNMVNNDNETPVLMMIKNKVNYRINDIIDDLYVNLNIQDKNYNSIIHYAIINFQKDLILLLIETINYVNWNIQDKNGNTILHLLIQHNYIDGVGIIINNVNINTNIVNINYETPIILFLKKFKKRDDVFKKYTNVIFKLLYNSSFYQQDKKGNCCLYYLLKYYRSYLETFKLPKLLNIVNNKGVSLKDLDKSGKLEFIEEKEEEKLSNIKYSTYPFDIFCFMVILMTKGVYLGIDFDKLVIKDKINIAVNDLFLIWNGELINKQLIEKIGEFEKSDKSHMVFYLSINYNEINHANVIIVSKYDNIVYRFDPYGYYYHEEYDLNKLDNILKQEVDRINKMFKLSYNYVFYDRQIGIQQIEENIHKDVNDLNGYCVSWCMLMVKNIVNNKKHLIDIVEIFTKLYNNNKYYEFKLKKNQETANKIRDIVLNKCGISYIDYINDNIDVNDSVRMIESIKMIVKKYI